MFILNLHGLRSQENQGCINSAPKDRTDFYNFLSTNGKTARITILIAAIIQE